MATSDVQLRTDRLLLREFREDDWAAALAWEADPQVVRYRNDPVNTDPAVTRATLARLADYRRAQPRVRFVFALAPLDQEGPIGWTMLRVTDAAAREGEIGWTVARDHWGQGHATEAARALLDFGFATLRLHRIFAVTHAANSSSERVMQKIGMRREGLFREKEWIKGAWCDVLGYAILDREWSSLAHT